MFFPPLQTQEGRAGEAHVRPAGEQAGADGAAGGSHEAAEGKTVASLARTSALLPISIRE